MTIKVGDSGGFVFKEPFVAYNSAGTVYTCVKLAQLTEYLAEGIDPKVKIYQPIGLEDEYLDDLRRNETIVTLVTNTGRKWTFPLKYVTREIPKGIPYHAVALSVNLQAMPYGKDYTVLSEIISEVVLGFLGVIPDIKPVEVSGIEYITEDDHNALQLLRDGQKTEEVTGLQERYDKLLDSFTVVVEQRDVLSAFIEECMCKNALLEHCRDPLPPTEPTSPATVEETVTLPFPLTAESFYHEEEVVHREKDVAVQNPPRKLPIVAETTETFKDECFPLTAESFYAIEET